jgi:molybdopterin synthase catalytic subunit
MTPPEDGNVWVGLSPASLPLAEAIDWATRPHCGAVVTFVGTARDHSEGRPDVELLEYEAYEEAALPRLEAVAAEARRRWPEVAAVALLHRTGPVALSEAAVVVAVSSPHRDAAFAAARFAIDALKATVPIWKREQWAGGRSWGLESQHLTDLDQIGAP